MKFNWGRKFISICFCVLSVNVFGASFSKAPDGYFFIKSVQSGKKIDAGYWDQPGRPWQFKPGANLAQYAIDKGSNSDQQYRFFPVGNGWYNIVAKNGGYIDVAGGKNANGANIQIWNKSNLAPQKFRLKHLGSGRWKIYTYWGRVVCTPRNYKNGANIHTWDDHNGTWMEWYFIQPFGRQVYIPPASSFVQTTDNSIQQKTKKLIAKVQKQTVATVQPPAPKPKPAPKPVVADSAPQKVAPTPSQQLEAYQKPIYTVQSGEEFVYGKIGLKKSGEIKYTLAVVRKPNHSKKISKREFDPYGPRPLSGGGKMRMNKNPKAYDKFDFWVIFNGQKMGPYDRVVEMFQNDPNPDDWVSTDGKRISFAAVKGDKYYPIIHNKPASYFWSVSQAPHFDRLHGGLYYTMQWNKNDFRLVENGKQTLRNWKYLKNTRFAENDKDFLYVGGETDRRKQYVYLNHQKIGGPYELVSYVGFIPGSNIPYFAGFNGRIANGAVHYDYKNFHVGDSKVPVPDGGGVESLVFVKDHLHFSIRKKDPKATKLPHFSKNSYQVYKYNLLTKNISHHGPYYYHLSKREMNGNVYYETYSLEGKKIFVNENGKVLGEYRFSSKQNTVARYYATEDGTFYTVEAIAKPGSHINYGGKFSFIIRKNNKKVHLTSLKGEFARVEHIFAAPDSNDLQLVINMDVSVGSKKRLVLHKGKETFINGLAYSHNMRFASKSPIFYSGHRETISGKTKGFQLYKNGQKEGKMWGGIKALETSDDGKTYAMLVTKDADGYDSYVYQTENNQMHVKKQLVVNGKVVPGRFGAPVWSKAYQKILVLAQEGDNQIRIKEID